MKKTIALIVLDGWGYREETKDNAVASAKKPFFDSLWNSCPHSLLKASGLAVGLPEGQMGNSEVGHTTIGAGSIMDTDLVRITKSAKAGEFNNNHAMVKLFEHVKKHHSTLHVMGLLSDGGVHSHEEHLYEFLQAAKRAEVGDVAIHVFTDGRDTGPQSGSKNLRNLELKLPELGPHFFIASISGRFYAMDRDNNWDRMSKAEDAIFNAISTKSFTTPSKHLELGYAEGVKDELLYPVIFETPHGHGSPIKAHDGVFIFNFRADRVRMLSKKLSAVKDIFVTTMTEYDKDLPFTVAFPLKIVETTIAYEVSKFNLTQAHIAETEKFPHATYFLNGGVEKLYPGEKHIMLESRKDIMTHDQAPEMRAEAIADAAIKEIEAGTNFIFINFANPDMVGHTANVPAIIIAIQAVDRELKRVITALDEKDGSAIIIADHGNAEVNIDSITKEPHTAHTINLVPCILTGAHNSSKKIKSGGLSNVAPTVLQLLGITKPEGMTGGSLLYK